MPYCTRCLHILCVHVGIKWSDSRKYGLCCQHDVTVTTNHSINLTKCFGLDNFLFPSVTLKSWDGCGCGCWLVGKQCKGATYTLMGGCEVRVRGWGGGPQVRRAALTSGLVLCERLSNCPCHTPPAHHRHKRGIHVAFQRLSYYQ